MYAIDFLTCSADEVIDRSAICHPSLFAEALRDVALIHARSAREMHDKIARRTAEGMARDCNNVADRLLVCGQVTGESGKLSFGELIQAFSVAARLQCVPPAVAEEIIGRS